MYGSPLTRRASQSCLSGSSSKEEVKLALPGTNVEALTRAKLNFAGYNQNWSPNYNGSEVVEKSGHGIIQVNFNYRVGVYGFFAGKAVEEHGDLNNGLRDQLALLEWIQENISKVRISTSCPMLTQMLMCVPQFGGDPNHVVIHGSSAGAGSVALHLIAPQPETSRLFAGGIMESVFIPHQPRKTGLQWQYNRFVDKLGCVRDNAEEEMACLRSKDTNATQQANVPGPFPGSSGAPFWYWAPVIDGDLIPDEPLKLFACGEFTKVPMIIGNNQNGTDLEDPPFLAPYN